MGRGGFVENWFRSWVRGIIQKCAARGKRTPTTAAKTVKTALVKNFVTKQTLSQILSDVERETVKPFVTTPGYLERRERFQRIQKLLGLNTSER